MLCSCYTKYISWTILAFSAVNVIFLGGKRRAFGGFVATLKTSYPNISLTEINWIGDSYSAFGYMTTGLSTAIIIYFGRRYRVFQFLGSLCVLVSCITSAYVPNPHWLFLTHTLVHGIGSSLILSTVGLVVSDHFPVEHRYHILATTLVSGGSVASIVFVVLFAFFIREHDWRWSFKALGIMYFLVTCSAALIFQSPAEGKKVDVNRKKESSSSKQVITRRQIPLIILWITDRILTSGVTYGLLMNLTDYRHRSVRDLVKSTVLTMLFASGEAVTYLIGAIVTALTKDLLKNRLKYILIVTSFVMALSLVAAEFCIHIHKLFLTLIFIAGFCLGPSITFLYPASEELTKLPGHIAYPLSLGGMGLGMMISPLISAKLAEMLNYRWFFLIQGALIFVKCLSLIIMTIIGRTYKKKSSEIKCLVVEEEA